MTHIRILICRVDDDDTAMTELASLDLPTLDGRLGCTLDMLEAEVAAVRQQVWARVVELQWEGIDAQAATEYRTGYPAGSVVADGYAPLLVASRFGGLTLRRQVLAHRGGGHVMPGDNLLPAHEGLVITRGLAEQACLLAQDLPFATAARLLGWQTGHPGLLSPTTLRMLVRSYGARIRALEQHEAGFLLHAHIRGQRLRGVPLTRPRRHPGWPAALSVAVERALGDERRLPPAGVSHSDWARVREAHSADPHLNIAALRRLGPVVAPGQMLLVLDEVLTPAQRGDAFHELRTACLLTADGRRYLSGTGICFLRQVQAVVQACDAGSLLVVADGADWIRRYFQDHLASFPGAEMLLDWYHLRKKCRALLARAYPRREQRRPQVRRLLRTLWAGEVPHALHVLASYRDTAADPAAIDTLCAYLEARAPWIPSYRMRRRQCCYIGNGLGENANDRIVVRRQKRRGMQWSAQTSDALAALRTLYLNEGWDAYWTERRLIHLSAAA